MWFINFRGAKFSRFELYPRKQRNFSSAKLKRYTVFLQCLPPQVRMVLASTKEIEDLEALASLADRVVEVATPSVSSIETSQLSTEVERLRTEITGLKFLVKSLSSFSTSSQQSMLVDAELPVLLHLITLLVFAGITHALLTKQLNAYNLVLGARETLRPVADGSQCFQPFLQLPIFRSREDR